MILRALLAVVLALTLALGWSLWRSEVAKRTADAATARATAAEARSAALSEALARDAVADGFTDTARGAMESQAAVITERLAALERRANDRPPVPTVCPVPDPDLLRESAEAAGRVRAAEGRLRDLRTPEG